MPPKEEIKGFGRAAIKVVADRPETLQRFELAVFEENFCLGGRDNNVIEHCCNRGGLYGHRRSGERDGSDRYW